MRDDQKVEVLTKTVLFSYHISRTKDLDFYWNFTFGRMRFGLYWVYITKLFNTSFGMLPVATGGR